jgi:crotonobetainyl-CoA:carnitine CoA-transferase CaiB-like acyl-CoA transferase
VRVLSMEQAVALPYATRHLADLGADVIRVQSHKRGNPAAGFDIDLTRNKRQLAIDLNGPDGAAIFLRVAAACDVVAHNFTPRVVRRFGIDYPDVRAVRPDVIYLSLTGFGTTGPWRDRPLYGPGAEAFSGHNQLVGDPDAGPGRPGLNNDVDNVTGLNAAFAVLAALDERDRSGRGQHIDISLYEAAVCQLGAELAGRAFGSDLPLRLANGDSTYAVHDVFTALGHDRHVAVAATADQTGALIAALGVPDSQPATLAAAIAALSAETVVERLQAAGIAAAIVADASDQALDDHLWARGYYGTRQRDLAGLAGEFPYQGPAWGGGRNAPIEEPRPVGADTRAVLREVAGLSEPEIEALLANDTVGQWAASGQPAVSGRNAGDSGGALGIERGELSHVDDRFDAWKSVRDRVGR